jgi:hypothetical protein
MKKFNEIYDKIINENAYSASKYLYKAIRINPNKIIDKSIINEAIEFEPAENEQGGMIIFSTEVNAIELSKNKFINWIKQKVETIKNKFKSYDKIDTLAKKYDLVGWTVGKFLNGRYTGRDGKIYDENSLSVEVVGIDSTTLINIAEDICREFNQESVLVKNYNTKKILFVNGE